MNNIISSTIFYIGTYLFGIVLMIVGLCLTAVWLAFCFGTIIIGILLLIFAPDILLFPMLLFFIGFDLMKEKN